MAKIVQVKIRRKTITPVTGAKRTVTKKKVTRKRKTIAKSK